ncbi:hypothetical protein LCGC14_1393370 [marine sediment metagenome]|uniref:Uncharacterized protein n=1 Tax=marine sediment metagenome TaxID=412755 RepID=A0A0F9KK34_9ZZZZ
MVDFCIKQKSDKKFVVYADHKNDSANDMKALIKFINEIVVWCKKTFDNDYETWDFKSNGCIFSFEKETEAMAFKLRWM